MENEVNGRRDVRMAHLALLLANIGWGVIAPVSKMVLLSGAITSLALSGIRISGGALLFLLGNFLCLGAQLCASPPGSRARGIFAHLNAEVSPNLMKQCVVK